MTCKARRPFWSGSPRQRRSFSAPAREVLEHRLRGRGTETEAALERRLAEAERELAEAGRYQHQVINDDIDQAVADICGILTSQWNQWKKGCND